jgi:hypothetical protein
MKTRLAVCLLMVVCPAANIWAADVTGTWKVTITLGGNAVAGVALLNQAGDKITGSIGANESNQHPLDGVVEGNRITLTTHPRPGRTVAFDKCYLTLDGEKMTGTTEGGDLREQATIELVKMK